MGCQSSPAVMALVIPLALAALLSAVSARAEHFDIHLTLSTTSGTADVGWDTSPPEGGVNPRPVVHAATGEDVTLQWRIRDDYPHGPMKQVRIRLYARSEGAVGQKRAPGSDAYTLLSTEFVADFLPDHSAHGHVRFRVPGQAVTWSGWNSANTAIEHGHEHFSALDLMVDAPR